MIKIGFDIGGVLSKYPEIFKPLIEALSISKDISLIMSVHVVEHVIE